MQLKNKVCAITGAGSGIGRAAAELFSREGAHVVILEVNDESGRCAADEIGDAATFIHTDVSDPRSVCEAFDEIKQRIGQLHCLYNNASVFLGQQDAPVTELDVETYHRVVAINQHSVFYCSKFAIPLIIASGGGAVINTASSAAIIGIAGCDAYTASKGATVTLTRSMAVEYGPKGVRVNCIAPAAIQTPMIRESDLDNPEFDEQSFLQTTPVRRWGRPEDIANVALFLAGDQSAYVNGAIIVADGGITITHFA